LTGRRFWTEVERLRSRQWVTPAELEARLVERLQDLLGHAAAHVPYYGELFADAGFEPRTIRSTEDLARVPITTKAALRRRFPEGVTANNLPVRRRTYGVTSGSTGQPFEFFLDRGGADAWTGSYLFFLEWAGTAFWHTEVVIASPRHFYLVGKHVGPVAARARRWLLGRERVWLGGPDTTLETLRATIDRWARRRPYHLWAYASYAARLARELLDDGRPLVTRPRAVFAVAETLLASDRAAIERAFRAPVQSHYSCLEIPRIAQTCPDNPAVLHVNAERAVVRVVDETGASVAPGELGRVVVTDLVNRVMPFINYELGDAARLGGPCPCGRGRPTLEAIEGRTNETLVTRDGRAISAAVLGQLLVTVGDGLPYVWEYQAVQESLGGVELRVVPTARYTRETGDTLRRQLETLLGPGTDVRVTTVDALERRPSGKRLAIESRLARSETGRRGAGVA
jgi:phenylacetate-CoA ligase